MHTDPYDAWASEVKGVVYRANDPKDGRMVDAMVFADSYAIGGRNFKAFYDQQRENPNANFVFLDNTSKPTLMLDLPKEAHEVDGEKLLQHAYKIIEERADTLRSTVVRGAMIHARLWPDQR